MSDTTRGITRGELITLLNEDLAREYQAIIAYVVYSQVLKGAEYMHRWRAGRAIQRDVIHRSA